MHNLPKKLMTKEFSFEHVHNSSCESGASSAKASRSTNVDSDPLVFPLRGVYSGGKFCSSVVQPGMRVCVCVLTKFLFLTASGTNETEGFLGG